MSSLQARRSPRHDSLVHHAHLERQLHARTHDRRGSRLSKLSTAIAFVIETFGIAITDTVFDVLLASHAVIPNPWVWQTARTVYDVQTAGTGSPSAASQAPGSGCGRSLDLMR